VSSETHAAEPDTRAAGIILIAAFVVTLGLFALHPGGNAVDFAEVLKNEARDRTTDAIVHGGYIAVMGVELVCFAGFAMRLGLQRMLVLAGLIFTAAGFAFLAGSMLLDGLVIPAIAQRFVDTAPAKLDEARTLFLFCGTAISFLMPIGLLFQAAGIAGWSCTLSARHGIARMAGLLGILLAILITAALALGTMNPLGLMGALLGTSAWALVVGGLLAARKV
jgi:hypothetical protein